MVMSRSKNKGFVVVVAVLVVAVLVVAVLVVAVVVFVAAVVVVLLPFEVESLRRV